MFALFKNNVSYRVRTKCFMVYKLRIADAENIIVRIDQNSSYINYHRTESQ